NTTSSRPAFLTAATPTSTTCSINGIFDAGRRELFALTNLRLFLRFEPSQWGKRAVQRVASGVICPAALTALDSSGGRQIMHELLQLLAREEQIQRVEALEDHVVD